MKDELRDTIEHQAGMESLWCRPNTIGEAILQAALRHLHAIVDEDPEIAYLSRQQYWNVDDEL